MERGERKGTERKDGKEEMNWENLGWKEIKRERTRGGKGERCGKGSGQESENGEKKKHAHTVLQDTCRPARLCLAYADAPCSLGLQLGQLS